MQCDDVYQFCILLAGMYFEIHTEFAQVRSFFEDYITSPASLQPVPMVISGSQEARKAEIENNEASDDNLEPLFPDYYYEELSILRAIAEIAPIQSALLMHGSALAMDGKGYIFTAPSGTGKSTHSRFWRIKFGNRVEMVNDDKPFLRFCEDDIYVCGSPWDGKHHLSKNINVPLRAILFLERGTQNQIERVPGQSMISRLYAQIYEPIARDSKIATLHLLSLLCERVPFYRLRCRPDVEAAMIAYRGLREEM